MTVLSDEWLDDLEDPGASNGLLDKAAPVEHLVTKGGGELGRISPLIGRILVEDPFDIGAEPSELLPGEDAREDDVSLCLEALYR